MTFMAVVLLLLFGLFRITGVKVAVLFALSFVLSAFSMFAIPIVFIGLFLYTR